jgi:membrane-associated phospholipid phosphatase
VSVALLGFFASYLAYRNIKSVAPLLRPGDVFDRQLLSIDRDLLGGTDPAAFLHDLLGTGIAAHALSGVYMLFFLFIPVSLAASLVFASDVRIGLFFTTALSLNWLLGAGSYLLLPSLGPFHADPGTFATLPHTTVTDLQTWLVDQRRTFLSDPATPGTAQSIGAFASLHMSIYCTGAVTAHLLGLPRAVRATLWILTGLTAMSTIYFGWHYVLDDVGGLVIAFAALALASVICGYDVRSVRRARRLPARAPEPA